MSTKLQKRKTKQIRVGTEIHKRLKFLAVQKETTISRLADELVFGAIRNMESQERTSDTNRFPEDNLPSQP